jgi:adenylate cyclase
MSATRKLLTVFYADVAGYSRLTGDDEEGTHRRVMTILDHATAAIGAADGTVLRYSGDAILASFPSVVKAVETSVSIQNQLAGINRAQGDQEPIQIRIGINLGDVLEDRGEVYGEGVNLAARLESAAQPGGICVSSLVHGQVAGKVDVEFHDGGEIEFKNIKEPTRVYYWSPDGLQPTPATNPKTSPEIRNTRRKPAIAVLPLANMSNDPEQEHFADGLTEDLITALSRKQWYDVAARNSTFTYKGQAVDVRSVGEHLAVDFVLEGSVRKSGNRARITVQLINARSGNHEWADKFDRDLDDVFSVQDEITHRVSAILGERIWQSVVKEIDDIDESDYGPFEWSYSAIGLIHQIAPESNRLATERLLKALAIDAEVAVVHLGLGFCYLVDWAFMGDSVGGSLEKAHEHAEIYQRLSPNDAHTYRMFSRVYAGMRRYEESESCVERAISIDPDDSDLILNKGIFLQQTGKPEEAIHCFDAVLNSHDETPHTVDIARAWKGMALIVMEDYAKAVTVLQEISGLNYLKNLFLAACHAALGDDQQARVAITKVLQACPDLRANNLGFCQSYQDTAIGDRLRLALNRAGLPLD